MSPMKEKRKVVVKDIPKLVKNKKGRFLQYRKKRVPIKSSIADQTLLKKIMKLFRRYVSEKTKVVKNIDPKQPEQSFSSKLVSNDIPHPNKSAFLDFVRLNNPKLLDDSNQEYKKNADMKFLEFQKNADLKLLEYKRELDDTKKNTEMIVRGLEKDIEEERGTNLDQRLQIRGLRNAINQGQLYLQNLANIQYQQVYANPVNDYNIENLSNPKKKSVVKKKKVVKVVENNNNNNNNIVADDSANYEDIADALQNFSDSNFTSTSNKKIKTAKKIPKAQPAPAPAPALANIDANIADEKNKLDIIKVFVNKQNITQLQQMWKDVTNTNLPKGFNSKNGPAQITRYIVDKDLIDGVFYRISVGDDETHDQEAPLNNQGIAPNPEIAFSNAGVPPPIIDSVENSQPPPEDIQEGQGMNADEGGLYNTDINHYMKGFKQFKGVAPIDMIHRYIHPQKNDKMFGFIMNTENHDVGVGHWVAIVISDNTIEYFDPLAQSPSPRFFKEIKKLVSKHFGKGNIYQLKVNYVKSQNNNTNTCGFHACKFLKDRFEGQNWKQATKFKVIEDSIRGEKDIKKFQDAVKQFDSMKF